MKVWTQRDYQDFISWLDKTGEGASGPYTFNYANELVAFFDGSVRGQCVICHRFPAVYRLRHTHNYHYAGICEDCSYAGAEIDDGSSATFELVNDYFFSEVPETVSIRVRGRTKPPTRQ